MLKVLIADDEERICKLIQVLAPWQTLGMTVCATASNGIEALQLLQDKKPDILLTDIRMPGCDGLTLISRAKALLPDLEIIIISGYAHFEYARTSIQYGVSDYLLKPINKQELTAALNKCAKRCLDRRSDRLQREHLLKRRDDLSRLRSGLVRDLIDERLKQVDPEKLDQSYRFFARPDDTMQVFILKFCSAEETIGAETLDVLCERVQEVFSSSLSSLCHDFLLNFREETGYGIMSFEPKQRQNIRKALRSCLNQFEVEKELYGAARLCIALGSAQTVAELAVSYQNASSSIMERLIEGPGKLLEGIPASSALPAQSILDRYSRSVAHAIDILSIDAATAALEQLRSSAMAIYNVRGRELVNLVHTASGIFTASLVLEDRDALLRDFYHDVNRCCTTAQLFGALDSLQQNLMQQIIQQRQSDELRPIRHAKQYIQDHFADPITLEEVADASGFSGSYFSTFFKKETGMGFNQYLTQVRMEQAKSLLRESELPVAEVCRQVGYHDAKHFNRLFSRSAGLTPGEYRKLYK